MSETPTPQDDDPAKGRFMFMQMMRLGGLLLVFGGILIISGTVTGPPALGYGLLVLGVVEFFIMPIMLAKRWKTPEE